MVSFGELIKKIDLRGIARAQVVDYSKVRTLCSRNPQDDTRYEVVSVWNPSTQAIDLVATFCGDESGGATIPLIGATFSATKDGKLHEVSFDLALQLAEGLTEGFLEAVWPHLEFMVIVRLYELNFNELPPDLDFDKMVGALGLPTEAT